MYERQFGLRENPFAAGHQSKYVYPSREHQEALAHLRFGIENREAFVLITGEVGTGKTTALYDALSEWKSRAVVALITNTALTRSELYEEICMRFGVPIVGTASKPQLIQQLERHLMVVRARGDFAILLIDEAQNLDSGLLEETRLLSNLEAQGQKLLQIFLVGQPELEDKLAQPELRQLRQRIAVHYRLRPLSSDDTERYIHHRITVAGGHALSLFPPDACAEVHAATHGIPREINTVAAQALLNAFVEDSASVRPEHVRAIVQDTGFQSVLDRPLAQPGANVTAAAAAAPTPPSPVVPPAADSPVPVSPPRDVPATTREVRQVPAPAPATARATGPAPPSSIEPEGQPMAGVRPAGSTESWQSWMDSLAKQAEDKTEANAGASASAAPVEPATPAEIATPEMSPEEFYAVEEAALSSPIGEEPGFEEGETEEVEDEEYDEEYEEGDEEGDDEEFDEEEEPAGDEPNWQGQPVQAMEVVEAASSAAPAAAESAPAPAAEDDMGWMEELTRRPETPAARPPQVEAAIGSADFETGPGIQWGDAASRVESIADEVRNTPAVPDEAPAEPARPMEAATGHDWPMPPRPAQEKEPAVARVSAAPARPMPAAQGMPARLRERLEAAEREESDAGGRLTGWLIGVGTVAVVVVGVLLAMRFRSQPEPTATSPNEVATATSGTETDASSPASGSTPVDEPVASAPAPPAASPKPPLPQPRVNKPSAATTASTTPSTPAVKPAASTPAAVAAPVVPKAVAPKPAAPKATYGISVASFLAEGRANSELARLTAATGVSGRVVTTPEGDYRVVLGSYPDRNAAENAAGDLIGSGKVDEARVVPLGSGAKR